MENLLKWCELNKLNVEIESNSLTIEGVGKFILVLDKNGILFDSEMNFLLSDDEEDLIESDVEISNIVFDFGGNYYYTPIDRDKLQSEQFIKAKFLDFKYLGKAKQDLELDFAHLGVHSEYELLNGSGVSSDWVKKAKFLGHKSLGICDKNTLAGVLSHQISCSKSDIKSIIGETITVKYGETDNGQPIFHELIVYCRDKQGWKSLLNINKKINIDNDGFITHDELLSLNKGLVLVLSKDSILNQDLDRKKVSKIIAQYKSKFKYIFYQIDSVSYFDERKYVEYANGIKNYISHYSDIEPILISDSYYIDPEYYISRTYLNEIKKVRGALSHEQYYKSLDENIESFNNNYDISDSSTDIILRSIENTITLSDLVDFQIDIGNHKLPEFEYDGDNIDLFFSLLEQGLEVKVGNDPKKKRSLLKYNERLEEEVTVIVEAGFVDYFLILWDIIKWAKDQKYLVGNARGSVGGSLIAYLLDITTVDPIQYDLLFERFLNKTRVSGERAKSADSLPDIDIDFCGEHRDKVKRYMEQKYGKDHVVSIGTYGRLKLKGAIKGLGRADNIPFQQVNFVTKRIEDRLSYTWDDLFYDSSKNKILKGFVQSHPDLINSVKPILNQAQTPSIHASAVVITPKKDSDGNPMTVFDWMPVRKIFDNNTQEWILISEWEGKYIERAGFLKEDILGISQLDKFDFIINLVKKTRGKKIVLEKIDMEDQSVFDIFKEGFNEDVFQFGTSGLQRYSKMVRPDSVEDLIAMNALYRPGPMGSDAHTDYALIKHGKKKPTYDFGLKDVTEKTYGLYVYQEQIMKAVHVLGGLTLSEADEVRTIMKKFDKVKMKTFKDKFIDGAKKKGCPNKQAEQIWEKLEKFSGYGFNRSHAAAYSIMAYWCQWLKCHYEEEFYTAALNFSKSENTTSNILDEIDSRSTGLQVVPPDINESKEDFTCDVNLRKIYWSLQQIKGVAQATVNPIIQERSKSRFKDIPDFLARMKGTGVGAGAAELLIKSGAFDNLYDLSNAGQRLDLIKELFTITKNREKLSIYSNPDFLKDYNWVLEQKAITGFGKIDYRKILKDKGMKNELKIYKTGKEFMRSDDWTPACIAGRLMYLDVMNTKKGKSGQLTLECNNKIILVRIWADVWTELEKGIAEIAKKKNQLLIVTGKIKYDDWNQRKVLFSDAELTDVTPL